MIKLCTAFILPHLEYCSPLFVGIGMGQRNHLEDGICYILKTLVGHNKSMSYDELLTMASMTSLYCRRLHQALILLFNVYKKMVWDLLTLEAFLNTSIHRVG